MERHRPVNKLDDLNRILCRHVWTDPGDWAAALTVLADFDDAEVAALTRRGSPVSAEVDGD